MKREHLRSQHPPRLHLFDVIFDQRSHTGWHFDLHALEHLVCQLERDAFLDPKKRLEAQDRHPGHAPAFDMIDIGAGVRHCENCPVRPSLGLRRRHFSDDEYLAGVSIWTATGLCGRNFHFLRSTFTHEATPQITSGPG